MAVREQAEAACQLQRKILKDRLARYHQVKISVIGRKSGRTISIPVCFVFEGDKLYLLPVQGSDTQWYQNLLRRRSIRISARGTEGVPIRSFDRSQSGFVGCREIP